MVGRPTYRAAILCAATSVVFLVLSCGKDKNTVLRPAPDPGPGTSTFDVFPVHQDGPSWSSTGLIAFRDNGIVCVKADGAFYVDSTLAGIWVINPRTGLRYRASARGEDAAWSPDGQRLALENGGQIFSCKFDGTDWVQLTTLGKNFFPRWSSNGMRVVFDSDGGNDANPYSIWIVNADGTGRAPLCGGGRARMPDIDHGQNVVFIAPSSVGSAQEVWTTDSLCTAHQLTSIGGECSIPRYSPSANFIAFSAQDAASALPEIWIANRDGTGLHQLTHQGATYPGWSPDADSLVCVRTDWNSPAPDRNVLWVVSASSGTGRQLLSQWPQQCQQQGPSAVAAIRREQAHHPRAGASDAWTP